MKPLVAAGAAALALALSTLPASAQDTKAAEATPAEKPAIAFARMVSSVPQGYPWITLRAAIFQCFWRSDGSKTVPWTGVTGEVRTRDYAEAVSNQLKATGFAPADDPDDLFKAKRQASDLAIAINVKDIKADLCATRPLSQLAVSGVPKIDSFNGTFLDVDGASGVATMTAEWQLYSRTRQKVLLTKTVVSRFELPKHGHGNLLKFINGAFDENVRAFISSSEFQAAAVPPTSDSVRATSSASKTPLALAGAKAAGPTKISDAVGSVVLVLSNGGHGSGFLVSTDGYVVTAEHVVGLDKYVKIRWSDGLEGLGEVVRTDKRRDVALIKTDPRGRQPLALHRAAPEPGDTVFAIGAPLDVKNQSTVTRGVASANRIMDGFSFIQSDVTVNAGNSGGPLLDEKGAVLGICDLSFRERGDVPTGINYFVPIDDALRFLSAEPQ